MIKTSVIMVIQKHNTPKTIGINIGFIPIGLVFSINNKCKFANRYQSAAHHLDDKLVPTGSVPLTHAQTQYSDFQCEGYYLLHTHMARCRWCHWFSLVSKSLGQQWFCDTFDQITSIQLTSFKLLSTWHLTNQIIYTCRCNINNMMKVIWRKRYMRIANIFKCWLVCA